MPTGSAALLDVIVPLGVPPIGTVDLGKLTFTGDCTTAPSVAFTGASFSLFNGFFGGSGLGWLGHDGPSLHHRRLRHRSARARAGNGPCGHERETVVHLARSERLAALGSTTADTTLAVTVGPTAWRTQPGAAR